MFWFELSLPVVQYPLGLSLALSPKWRVHYACGRLHRRPRGDATVAAAATAASKSRKSPLPLSASPLFQTEPGCRSRNCGACGWSHISCHCCPGRNSPDRYVPVCFGCRGGLVPECLLPTATRARVGAQRMAEHKVLVRGPEAIETLGSSTTLITRMYWRTCSSSNPTVDTA